MFEYANNSTEHSEIFLNVDTYNSGAGGAGTGTGGAAVPNGLLLKRRASDNFISHEWNEPSSKRPHHSILFNNHLQSLAYGGGGTAANAAAAVVHPAAFLDYHHLASVGGSFANAAHNGGEPLGQSYRDAVTDRDHHRAALLSASAAELFGHRSAVRNGTVHNGLGSSSSGGNNNTSERPSGGNNPQNNNNNNSNGGGGGDEEWKNIHTMLNCISGMVEKTKRAITILQQRGQDTQQSYQETALQEMKRLTDEKVAEFKRNAEEAVNQVKRQAVIEIQRAVAVAENRAVEIVAQERVKMEKLFAEINGSKVMGSSNGSGGSSLMDGQQPPDVVVGVAENSQSNVSEGVELFLKILF